jgi:hypothetical protein
MDNRFTFEADFPTGTKVLVYDGEDADGNIRTFPRTLRRTTHLMPPNYYLGRRIQGFDLSRIFDNAERDRIENERRLAWRQRINDNNNVDPVAVPARMDDNAIPLGRNLAVPMGGSPGFRPAQRTPQALAPLSDNARFERFQADRDAERADNVRLIREERMLRRRLNGLGRRVYDNNNPDPNAPPPVQMDDVVPMGRVLVPQGGRKSRRGRKSKKSRKRRSHRRGRR